MRPSPPHRPTPEGFTLPELLLAVVLSGIVLSAVAGLLNMAGLAFRVMIDRAEQAELRRTIASVLLEELGRGVNGIDWILESPQAIQLRAFRGEARGCGLGSDGRTLLVLRRGERQAEALRDSVLVLEREGGWKQGRIRHIRSGGEPGMALPAACLSTTGERLERWEVEVGTPPSVWVPIATPAGSPFFLRYFESGRYSLEDAAFRYRRGTAGRQPLTLERVAPDSHFEADRDGVIVHLVLSSAGGTLAKGAVREGPVPHGAWSWSVPGGRVPGLLPRPWMEGEAP
jgi:prepilin-type N-terminal cleavage/methylation domain-containing protein